LLTQQERNGWSSCCQYCT